MKNLKHELWNKKGYDFNYLDSLTEKELISLHDTEFFYED